MNVSNISQNPYADRLEDLKPENPKPLIETAALEDLGFKANNPPVSNQNLIRSRFGTEPQVSPNPEGRANTPTEMIAWLESGGEQPKTKTAAPAVKVEKLNKEQKISDEEILKMADTVLNENKGSPYFKYMQAFRDQVADQIKAGKPVGSNDDIGFGGFGQRVTPDGKITDGNLFLNKKYMGELKQNFEDKNIRDHFGYLMVKEGVYAHDYRNDKKEIKSLMAGVKTFEDKLAGRTAQEIPKPDKELVEAAKHFLAKATEHEVYAYEKALDYANNKGYLTNTKKYEKASDSLLADSLTSTRGRIDQFVKNGKFDADAMRTSVYGFVAGERIEGQTAHQIYVNYAKTEIAADRWKIQPLGDKGYKVLTNTGENMMNFINDKKYRELK